MISLPLIELFTSPTCPYCPAAKKVAKEVVGEMNGGEKNLVKNAGGTGDSEKKVLVELREYDTWEETGQAKAREYGIMAVPSIIVSGAGINEKILVEGAPSKKDLLAAIEMAEGKRSIEKKKSFWGNLFG